MCFLLFFYLVIILGTQTLPKNFIFVKHSRMKSKNSLQAVTSAHFRGVELNPQQCRTFLCRRQGRKCRQVTAQFRPFIMDLRKLPSCCSLPCCIIVTTANEKCLHTKNTCLKKYSIFYSDIST